MNFSPRDKKRGLTEINLTPLIDVVFILLIFFLITSTFVQNPGIEVQLPKASSAPPTSDQSSLVITVTDQGRIIHHGEAVGLDELKSRLEGLHAKSPDQLVIVQADQATQHGQVVEVMDLARTVGFSMLAIATEGAQ